MSSLGSWFISLPLLSESTIDGGTLELMSGYVGMQYAYDLQESLEKFICSKTIAV